MAKTLNSRIPEGPVAEKWTNYKAHQRLVNPKNKLKLDVIVVGTGLAGASAAASLGEMGFNILNFCIQDSPRRAHSIAAQGGINAAKNYQNDGDSVYRLFYDTVKGGDYRAREASVYRLAEVSNPFTMPYEEDLPYLMTDPARVRSQAYDVVLNGIELGSGSIRIHRPDVQALMFRALGFTEETARARFGFMIDAFKYGTPPHGGFAFGLDRLVMQLLGADSLRDVIAFPKVRDASDLMTSAPDFVDAEQLEVLQLGVSTAAEAEKHPQKKRPTMAIKTVAELAKLSLTAEEEVTMGEELNTILGFAEALQEVDTTDVPQTAHVIPTENVLREDIPAAPFDRDLLLSNAPTRTEDCVNVPQTFD